MNVYATEWKKLCKKEKKSLAVLRLDSGDHATHAILDLAERVGTACAHIARITPILTIPSR